MARRSYSYYKTAGYKLPALTWVMNQGVVYAAVAAVGLGVVGNHLYQSKESLDRTETPYTPNTPYMNVSMQSLPSQGWAKNYLAGAPKGQKSWVVSNNNEPRNPLTFQECETIGLEPKTLLATYTAEGDSARVAAQVYQPGTGKLAFESYKKAISQCDTVKVTESSTSPTTEVAEFSDGFFFLFGDALVFVVHQNATDREAFKSYFTSRAAVTLSSSGCAELTVDSTDPNRNLFTTDKFTGLLLSEVIKTNVPLGNLPNPVFGELRDLSYMDQPEGPLDKSIPTVPRAPDKPVVEKIIRGKVPEFEKTVQYQVDDTLGPGCGWKWAGMNPPITSAKKMDEQKNKTFNSAQNSVDTAASKFVSDKIASAASALTIMQQVDVWNNYTVRVDKIHDRWTWLNDERQKIMTPWFNYVEAHNNWSSFDYRKEAATQQYTRDVQQCNAANQAVRDWDARYGGIQQGVAIQPQQYTVRPMSYVVQAPKPVETTKPTPSPTATVQPSPTPTETMPTPSPTAPSPTQTPEIPPRPPVCGGVAQPSILSQEKGAEPKPPRLAEGVTVPGSWPKPNN